MMENNKDNLTQTIEDQLNSLSDIEHFQPPALREQETYADAQSNLRELASQQPQEAEQAQEYHQVQEQDNQQQVIDVVSEQKNSQIEQQDTSQENGPPGLGQVNEPSLLNNEEIENINDTNNNVDNERNINVDSNLNNNNNSDVTPNVVANINAPAVNITPTPTPPILAPAGLNVTTDVTSNQLPPLPVPKDRKESLQLQIEKDNKDIDAWIDLINYMENIGKDLVGDEVEQWWLEYTKIYDDFFKIWPCAVKQWQAYIDKCLSMTPPKLKKVEEIFSKALKQTPSPEFWSSYLNYIRRNNESKGLEGRQTIIKAYEFAISHVGQDKDSGEIWLGYIRFLKEGQANNTWEEQQRMDALRRTYQRAVLVPIQNVEAIWREWDNFEGSLNKVTAKKFLADKSPAYMTARSALREMRSLTDPPISLFHIEGTLAKKPSWTERERQVLSSWKRYLAWEESNPLEIEDENLKNDRVSYAFKKSLVYMRFYPEIWYRAYTSHKSMGREDEAFNLLKQGNEANPDSYLLTFALAEIEELHHHYRESHDAFNRLSSHILDSIKNIETYILRQQAELNNQLPLIEHQANSSAQLGEFEGDIREKKRLAEVEINEKKEAVAKSRSKEIEELCKGLGLIWVMKMRLGRRSEGIKGARLVFKEARTSPYCTWQVFEAGAMMEYHSSKDPSVATKIFELGLKRFSLEIEYVTKYLDFLISINDEGNARALFERVAPNLPSDKARPLWSRWAAYEYTYSDLPSALKLESRLAETFPDEQPLRRFAERHTHQRIDKIATSDLGFGIKPPTAPIKIMEANAQKRTQPVDLEEERNKRLRKDSPVVIASEGVNKGGRNSKQSHQNQQQQQQQHQQHNQPHPLPQIPVVQQQTNQQMPLPLNRNSPIPNIQIGGAPIHIGMQPPKVKDPLSVLLTALPSARYFDGPIINTEDLLFALRNLNLPQPPT